jgi:hypothetical protein
MNHLLTEEQLTEIEKVIDKVMSQLMPVIKWEQLDDASRQAFRRYLLFSDGDTRRAFGLSHFSEVGSFYNSYYWMLIFCRRYQSAGFLVCVIV